MIVKGHITPDEFYVFKPTLKKRIFINFLRNMGARIVNIFIKLVEALKKCQLSKKIGKDFSSDDKDILTLAKWGCIIEEHYGLPQDIEWAKDGKVENCLLFNLGQKLFMPRNRKSLRRNIFKRN
jgi:pyruvate,water dikinase